MKTRQHIHQESFIALPERVFALLHTPSAIRQWWGASQAIVIPRPGGFWAAAWGANDDDPDYVTSAILQVFDPPRRILFSDFEYYSKAGPLPFEAKFSTEFLVSPTDNGATLRVVQGGFPIGSEADAFYEACETGWRNTFAGIRRFLENESS